MSDKLEMEQRKIAVEFAVRAAAASPALFAATKTNAERNAGQMIVRDAKTIYKYLFQEKQEKPDKP